MTLTDPMRAAIDEFDLLRLRIETGYASITLNQLVDAAADAWPSEPAINFFQQEAARYTFKQIRHYSCALAIALREQGVRQGSPVAVVLPNVPLFPFAWLALARLGAVMIPVNPKFTPDEMRFILTDTRATHVIAHHSVLPVVREALIGTNHVICLTRTTPGEVLGFSIDSNPTVLTDEPLDDPAWPEVSAQDAVGIHYTSGTTGFPKGCVLTHESWAISASVAMALLPERPRRILSDAPYFYLDAPLETICALVTGAEQYVADHVSLSRFTAWLADFDIDYVEMWDALAEAAGDPDAEARLRARSRRLYCSSFGMTEPHRQTLEDRLGAVIREMFGMSEIGLGTAMPYSSAAAPAGSCGLAAPFRETRIVNPDDGTDVEPGAVGELWIRGRGVMLGYHDRPEANAATRAEGGWFRTGDLMRRDANGYHFVVGRLKDMIRRSDENIAAAEVEAALHAVMGIAEAAVVGVPDPMRGEEVKAFVVLKPDLTAVDVPPAEIIGELAQHLAPFKVPRFIEYIDSLPLTPSGKVAKAELRSRDERQAPGGFDRIDNVWRT